MRFYPAALLLVCAAARAEEIRIEIGRGARKARVEVSGRAHEVAVRGAQVLVDGAPGPAEFAGPLKLDGRALAGRLELFADKGGLVAVNVVDLEDYVAAVVASEVPASWPADALRAQAVAARTFAVAQKISQGPGARAHLGASVLDQVYKGTAHPEPQALKAARDTFTGPTHVVPWKRAILILGVATAVLGAGIEAIRHIVWLRERRGTTAAQKRDHPHRHGHVVHALVWLAAGGVWAWAWEHLFRGRDLGRRRWFVDRVGELHSLRFALLVAVPAALVGMDLLRGWLREQTVTSQRKKAAAQLRKKRGARRGPRKTDHAVSER